MVKAHSIEASEMEASGMEKKLTIEEAKSLFSESNQSLIDN